MNKYLKSGKLTKVTKGVIDISNKIDIVDGYVIGVLYWMQKNLRYKRPLNWKDIFNKRTAEEIIESGFITGCTDSAIVFATLCRAHSIPAKIVETISQHWLNEPLEEKMLRGHAFVEIWLGNGNKPIVVDPDTKRICLDESKAYGPFIKYGEGLDSYEIGFSSFGKMERSMRAYKIKYHRENLLVP